MSAICVLLGRFVYWYYFGIEQVDTDKYDLQLSKNHLPEFP